jgi:nicotinamide riboside transporter PnuC
MNWTILITIASIISAVANIYKQAWGFALWLATNTLWAVYNYRKRELPQSILYVVYAVLAVWGLLHWRV